MSENCFLSRIKFISWLELQSVICQLIKKFGSFHSDLIARNLQRKLEIANETKPVLISLK